MRILNLSSFHYPRAGHEHAESVPVIHNKWRRSNVQVQVVEDRLAPGAGDLERLNQQEERVQLVVRRICLGIRCLQMICAYFSAVSRG
jgi:hypothetical protein